MLIENPVTMLAVCTAVATAINLAILRFSPQIKVRARHAIAGIGPAVATLGALVGLNDSVVASGSDLLVLGGSAAAGLAAAIGSTWYVKPQRSITHR